MRTFLTHAAFVGVGIIAGTGTAGADATLLFGVQAAAATRPSLSVAYGHWSRAVGYEVEYAYSFGQGPPAGSSLGTAGVTVLVRTPFRIRGAEIYGAGGFGIYGEAPQSGSGSLEMNRNIGVGATIGLQGRVKLRLDYRLFVLGRSVDAQPLQGHFHRVAAGLSLGF